VFARAEVSGFANSFRQELLLIDNGRADVGKSRPPRAAAQLQQPRLKDIEPLRPPGYFSKPHDVHVTANMGRQAYLAKLAFVCLLSGQLPHAHN
jgi:hypothetical protein